MNNMLSAKKQLRNKIKMKEFVILVLVFQLFGSSSWSQSFPNYGRPGDDELNMTTCSFDPEADAIALVKDAIAYYNDEHNLITEYHVRIKILKESGIARADVVIPYYHKGEYEFIDQVQGAVINMVNGAPQYFVLEKKNTFHRKFNEYWSRVTFTFPAVRVGSIIEYTYRSVQKNYNGLEDWSFQLDIPVLRSKYSLTILPNAEFSYVVHKSDQLPVDIKSNNNSGFITFEMQKIQALTAEPYMDARKDYLQRVAFQLSGYESSGSKIKYMTSWKEVIRELFSRLDFGIQLNKNIPDTEEFIKEAKTITDELTRVRMVHKYVQSRMKWNGFTGKYTGGIKEAWKDKTGSIADINLLLVNLLQSAGLQAYPLLVSERSNGKVSKDIPFIDQFSSVFALVKTRTGDYYLNATDYLTPVHIIPDQLLNTSALLVDRKIGGIIDISDESKAYRETISVIATIQPDMMINGECIIQSSDYARVAKLAVYQRDPNDFINRFYTGTESTIHVDSFAVNNLEIDTLSLKQVIRFNKPAENSGEYYFLQTNIFTGFKSNPFISQNRSSNINFGFNQDVMANVRMHWPEDYQPDDIPKSIHIANSDKSMMFVRDVFTDIPNRVLLTRYRFKMKSFHEAGEYPELKAFYTKMYELLKEPVVIRKK